MLSICQAKIPLTSPSEKHSLPSLFLEQETKTENLVQKLKPNHFKKLVRKAFTSFLRTKTEILVPKLEHGDF